jgi:MFS family permease
VSGPARALLRRGGFSRLLAVSLLARLPSGMLSLAVVLTVHGRTGSFLTAGLAAAALTLAGALAGPVLAAIADRSSHAHVLVPAAAAQACGLCLLALAGSAPALVGYAALTGAVQPPLAGCVRACWPAVAGELLDAAYALDASFQELVWTLGPLLVGLVAALASPAASLLLCGAAGLAGTLGFCALAPDAGGRARRELAEERSRTALSCGALRALLASVLLAGAVIGAVEVGLPALAAADRADWAPGPLLALFSLGSMAGGLLHAARTWRLPPAGRYPLLLLALAAGVVPLAAVDSVGPALPLAFLAGLGLAPVITVQLALVGSLAPVGTEAEAFTWHRTATIAGMAAGSAVAGALAQTHGAGAAFALGCTGVTLACLLSTRWPSIAINGVRSPDQEDSTEAALFSA